MTMHLDNLSVPCKIGDVAGGNYTEIATDGNLVSPSLTGRKIFVSAAKTDDYTLTSTDELVTFNGTDKTATLPTAVGETGRSYYIKNLNATALTVDGNASETIDGETTQSLAQWTTLAIVSDGSNWIII
ncbi:MAG: hypothetical protein GY807_18970 [Gammaproteobacteria bacterium]|nr:hypothetical protein [Gammaproteobacteria bacterium]